MHYQIKKSVVIATSENQQEAQTLLALMFSQKNEKPKRKVRTQISKDRKVEYARKAAQLYTDGVPVVQIAQALGLSYSNTYRYVKMGGATLRKDK